jgi:hypothetical protein
MHLRLLASQFAAELLTRDLMIKISFDIGRNFIYLASRQNDNELHPTFDKKEEIKDQV